MSERRRAPARVCVFLTHWYRNMAMSRVGIQLHFLLCSVSAFIPPFNLDKLITIPTGMKRERESARPRMRVCVHV